MRSAINSPYSEVRAEPAAATAIAACPSWPAAVTDTPVSAATLGSTGARNVKFQAAAKAATPNRLRTVTVRGDDRDIGSHRAVMPKSSSPAANHVKKARPGPPSAAL